jgi:hypothetical protein
MSLYDLGRFDESGSPPQVLLEHGYLQKLGRRKLCFNFLFFNSASYRADE